VVNENVDLTATATDADGDTVSYAWTAAPGAGVINPDNVATVVWTTPGTENTAPGYSLTVEATDGSATAELTIVIPVDLRRNDVDVTFEFNNFPIVNSLVPDPSRIDVAAGDDTTTLTLDAQDDDVGDTLSFAWTATGCLGNFLPDATTQSPSFQITDRLGNDTCTLAVVITDNHGDSNDAQVVVETGPSILAEAAPPVLCPCWDGQGGFPASLAAYWSNATVCSSPDFCQNTAPGSPQFDSYARCGVDGVNTTFSSYVDQNETGTDKRCMVQLAGGFTQVPFLSDEQYAACLADHQAFTQNKNSSACGLPTP
jgi:hypothetical protein